MVDPQTLAEWQEAVDTAKFFMALNDARLYGLIKGGPELNVPRAAWILAEGAKRGIRPKPIEELIKKAFP